MTGGTRLALLAAALVILVGAFVVLRPSDDDETETAATPTATPTETATEEAETPAPTETPTPTPTVDPGPLVTGEKVVKLRADKGDVVRFRVRPPEDEEVHIHGYDIAKDVKAGQTTRFFFRATIDGIFEIEFEHSGTQIAELRVDP